MKLRPQTTTAHACSVGQNLHMKIDSVFGLNTSPHNWQVLAECLYKKSECVYSFPDLDSMSQKQSALIDLVKLPKDTDECIYLLVPVISDRIKNDVVSDCKRVPTQNLMLIDENILAGT